MAEAGHYEALRKERILQRKREWERLTGSAGSANYQSRGNSSQFNANESKVPMSYRQPQSAYTQGRTQNYEQELRNSSSLTQFRVNQEGFWNRYRGNDNKAPHTDSVYHVMYPEKDNTPYTCDPGRNNRRHNVRMSRYYARQAVNYPQTSKMSAKCY